MMFSESFLNKFDPLIKLGVVVHDLVSDFLAKYLKQVKIGLLLMAHFSLLGFLFPQVALGFGSFARDILLVIMFSSPAAKLFRMKLLYQIVSLRRELGIWFAYLGIVHGMSFMLDPNWFDIFIAPYASQMVSMLPRYLFGVLALFLTLPLLITSNTLSTKLLKRNWKRVHWLTYPMFAAVLLHNFLPRYGSFVGYVFGWAQFAVVFGGYVLIKVLANNNFVAPLRQTIEYVGKRYAEYAVEKRMTQG